MSRPSDFELGKLDRIADDLFEVFDERGHRVDEAMSVDPAFGSGQSRAWVRRDLAVDTVIVAASTIAVDFRPVNGAGREFRFLSNVDRRYRFLRGRRDDRDRLHVSVNSASSLTVDPSGGLYPFEQWVVVWVMSDTVIAEVVACEVTGVTYGRPGELIFGEMISLGKAESRIDRQRRFQADVDDDIFGDEGDEEGEGQELA